MIKKWLILIFSVLMIFSLTACSAQVNREKQQTERNFETSSISDSNTDSSDENKENNIAGRRIKVTAENGDIVIFVLNDSHAALDLYSQLPITVKVDNFSNNEKIFYPKDKLSTKNTPNPLDVEIGTLAYYKPWGNVVMFYDSLKPNSDLYELGRAVSGRERIEYLSGIITVEKFE